MFANPVFINPGRYICNHFNKDWSIKFPFRYRHFGLVAWGFNYLNWWHGLDEVKAENGQLEKI